MTEHICYLVNQKDVEFIVMATGTEDKYKETPIHFTIFLNTKENLPEEIKSAILEKFLLDYKIKTPIEVLSQLMAVGFSQNANQESAMPMLLIKQTDMMSIPHIPLHVIDFLADSDNFDEAKVKGLTGWTYSYE